MRVEPKDVINALMYRQAKNCRIWIDGDKHSFQREPYDILTDLYNTDPDTVLTVLRTLETIGYISFDDKGLMRLSKQCRKYLVNGNNKTA